MIPQKATIRSTILAATLQSCLAGGLLAGVALAVSAGWIWSAAVGLLVSGTTYKWCTRRLRRRLAITRQPVPSAWTSFLSEHVALFARLDPAEQVRFGHLVSIFLNETTIVGVGCVVDEELRLLIAAGAVIPIFGFPRWEYEGLQKILVYPTSFASPFNDEDDEDGPQALGMVTDTQGILSGLVVFSAPDVWAGFTQPHDRSNVAIHEFAHLVDLATGRIDGYPAGLASTDRAVWDQLIDNKFQNQLRSDIPPYGFTNREEFFAVCSEYFFENPDILKKRHPELYRMLRGIYRQDTAQLFPKTLSWRWRLKRKQTQS